MNVAVVCGTGFRSHPPPQPSRIRDRGGAVRCNDGDSCVVPFAHDPPNPGLQLSTTEYTGLASLVVEIVFLR